MPLTKLVNGALVEMSPSEEAAFVAGLPGQQIPQEVTMRQARLALLAIGKLGDVATLIAALPEPQRAVAAIEWEFSNAVRRDHPFVEALGPALGVDLDDLFRSAAEIP